MTSAVKTTARPSLAQLLLPYWVSEDRYWAWGLLATNLTINFGTVYVSLATIRMVAKTTDAMVARDWPTLWGALGLGLALGMTMAFLAIINYAAQDYLRIRWRTWMTHGFIHQWTVDQRFYGVERDGLLSNADQRMAEDIDVFVQRSLSLSVGTITAVVNAFAFGAVLWSMSGTVEFNLAANHYAIPGYLLYAVILYSLLGMLIAHWMGKPLIALNARKQTVEADFRALGMNLRENAEQIAFYSGGPQEGRRMMRQFREIQLNFVALLIRTCKLSITNVTYFHIGSLVPTALSMPRYLSGAASLGDITQITASFERVHSSLNYFIASYVDFSIWLASANRLRDFKAALDKLQFNRAGINFKRSSEAVLTASPLALEAPTGELLSHVAAIRIEPGQRWLIRGASGSGKSTLMRALSGLWPHGNGDITLPGSQATTLFVPQKSYIPEGSLKAALCYPDVEARFTTEQCRQALLDVGLTERAGSLSVCDDWQKVLSGGEQQRLAIARVLLQQPQFVFFDEATSGLDTASERALYQVVFARLSNSAIISISHNPQLDSHYSHQLNVTSARHAVPA
ncbi:ABC transporter ATP-binding protein/permease [Pseudomonas fluorescens]|jgi:putative ATP-binding cassette transporter|uniref:ABC transporter ATP-binding protein/permease n=1 Tax=Pseudomonas fluorescens TaxID=294 RepID=UPI002781CC7C|nr:ABC transporter ATP-binding protein/permease [Pseudomonas fluorescens]MDP9781748.1 putative ATP-binding cassette transporter [Pseudomonas fluorescens]